MQLIFGCIIFYKSVECKHVSVNDVRFLDATAHAKSAPIFCRVSISVNLEYGCSVTAEERQEIRPCQVSTYSPCSKTSKKYLEHSAYYTVQWMAHSKPFHYKE